MTFGADHLVIGGCAITAYFRISTLFIELTVASFEISFPEFIATLQVGHLHRNTPPAAKKNLQERAALEVFYSTDRNG